MTHAASGSGGSVSIAGTTVARLLDWDAEVTETEIRDTAAGDAAEARIFPRIDWTFRGHAQVQVTGATPAGGGAAAAVGAVGTAVAVSAKRAVGDTGSVFTATGGITRFRVTSGGIDGVHEFEFEAKSSEGTVPTWIFT